MFGELSKKFASLFLVGMILSTIGCFEQISSSESISKESIDAGAQITQAQEVEVLMLRLDGALADPQAEISGLAWFGEVLILLPQYPGRYSSSMGGSLFGIHKADLLSAIQSSGETALEPFQIPFDDGGLSNRTPGFEGFEAVAFLGSEVFLTIESRPSAGMKSKVVKGVIEPDYSKVTLTPSVFSDLPVQSASGNKSYEALLVVDQIGYAIYEVNGTAVNPAPIVHQFDTDLGETSQLPFPTVEFRITDASEVDNQGHFWVINYFYPGDGDLSTDIDALADLYGLGQSHLNSSIRERLVPMQIVDGNILLAAKAPIYLELLENIPRNWEGLARLDEAGLLIATDKFPETLLGFVPFP